MEESLDEFGSPAAFQIIFSMRLAGSKQIISDEVYDAFAIFPLKQTIRRENILQTAVDISLAFREKIKMNMALIENLKKLLYKRLK